MNARGGADTALTYAAFVAAPDRVRQLLRAGADVRLAPDNGFTALHAAAARGSVEKVVILLDAGADPCASDDDGATPLDVAVEIQAYQVEAALRLAEFARRACL